jgi:hypothetical protein
LLDRSLGQPCNDPQDSDTGRAQTSLTGISPFTKEQLWGIWPSWRAALAKLEPSTTATCAFANGAATQLNL